MSIISTSKTTAPDVWARFKPFLSWGALVVVAVLLFPWLFFPDKKERASLFINIFLGLIIEAMPFLLLGSLFAAGLAVWGIRWTEKLWQKTAHSRAGSAAVGVGMGFAIPVCECGASSVARQAARDGAPLTLTLVFILAAPIVNPITILVTWLAFADWGILLGRIGLALLIAVGVGLLFSFHPHPQQLIAAENADHHDHEHHEHDEFENEGANKKFFSSFLLPTSSFLERATAEFTQAAQVAIPGIALAAAFQAYLPSHLFLDLGQGALLSAIALMLLAALMSVCSSVDAFVALGFAGLFPTGSVLAFLVFGPLINLKSLPLMRLVLRRQAIAMIALLTALLTLVAAVAINLNL